MPTNTECSPRGSVSGRYFYDLLDPFCTCYRCLMLAPQLMSCFLFFVTCCNTGSLLLVSFQDVEMYKPSPNLHQHLYPGCSQPLPTCRAPALPSGLAHQLPPTKFDRASSSDHGSRRQSSDVMLSAGGGAVSGGGGSSVVGMQLSIIMERCGSPGNDGSGENGAGSFKQASKNDAGEVS
jgi:uncharacterized membrane protein YgcG